MARNIVADKNIPYAPEAFGTLGEVRTLVGRDITAADVRDADLLIIRSTLKVNRALLEGSRVRFVATATIGTDHVDLDYLAGQRIEFASAAGSNANSVAEWVSAALLVTAGRRGFRLAGRSIGVVGVGNVGSRVVKKAEALGITVVQNDPPLARETGDARYRSLEDALGCDVVTFHVPLTREGQDATYHMADRALFQRMRPGAVLVNSSRGAVVVEQDLREALRSGHISASLHDVWEGEPELSPETVAAADVATPHIAGHSFDGKVAGTAMVYEAACGFLGVEPSVDVLSLRPPPEVPQLVVRGGAEPEDVVRETVLQVYDIRKDDAAVREMAQLPDAERGEAFASYRRNYPVRREFYNIALCFEDCPAAARETLLGLGFRETGS